MTIDRRSLLRGLAAGSVGALASSALARAAMAAPAPTAAAAPASATTDPTGTGSTKTVVTAADGTQWAIGGVNIFRGAGVLVQFTPDYGFSTFTNQWGAEAALVATGQPNQYRVTAVASAKLDVSTSGNMAIPATGVVLSAGPADAGQPDPVAYLTQHFAVGDLVTLTRPTAVDSTFTVAGVDPTAESNPAGAPYPAGRGPDQLIVYTPAHGSSTGTNQWGVELTVRSGQVTLVYAGGNSVIPSDGYVLSGNGLAATWLQTYGQVGAEVTLEGETARIHSDVGTAIANATSEVDAAAAAVQDSHDRFLNAPVDQAAASIATARSWLAKAAAIKGTDDQTALYYCDCALSAARDAYYQSLPARAADARGVWYQASEKTAAAVRATVARMKQAGVNEVYLETFYNGYTIYPSQVAPKYGLPAQMPAFAGFDPLQVWQDETARQGIALHAWITGLAVGNKLGDGAGVIVTTHPEWIAVGRDHVGDSQPAPSFNGFYWLDASNPQARAYLIEVCAEMVGRYGLAGIDLDYMRYADDGDWRHSFNFSAAARTAFQQRYGIDPLTLSPETTAQQWATWTSFSDDEQTRLVVDLYRAVKAVRPSAVVSDAPEVGSEADKIGQWSVGLDVVIPQAYTTDTAAIHSQVAHEGGQLDGGQLVYTGVSGMYSRNGANATVRQAVAAKDLDAGTVIFSFDQAGWAHVHALSTGAWRSTAVQPALHPIAAVKALLAESTSEISQRYVPRAGMASTSARVLAPQIEAVANILTTSATDGQLNAADQKLRELAASVDAEATAGRVQPAVKDALTAQIGYCRRIVGYALSRHMR
jgi:Glycosyl hydrolase-like 10